MADNWSCYWIKECVRYTSDELRTLNVSSWYVPDGWGMVKPCKSCRRRRGGSHRKCQGWRLSIWGKDAIVFNPVDIKGSSVKVRLEGNFSTVRSPACRDDWSLTPMKECTVVIKLYDPTTDNLLCRQHLDLANPDQPGSVWHLQLGGINGDKQDIRVVAALRWPTIPMDFMLAVELCTYLFHFEAWNDVRKRSPWKDFVKASERLVIPHYIGLLNDYFNRNSRFTSWLAAQCNQQGELNPRPR